MTTPDEHTERTHDDEPAVNRGHEDVPSDYAEGTGPSHRTTPNRDGVDPTDSAAAVNPGGGPAIEGDDDAVGGP